MVNKTIRDQIGAKQGDTVQMVMERDTEVRRVDLPEDLEQALRGKPEAKAIFDSLSYSHQKEYADWIMAAKKEETRLRRIESTLVRLSAGGQPLRGKR